MPLEGVSGEVIAKQAADMADQFSQIMQTGDPNGVLYGVFGPQYQEIMSGAIPGSEAYRQISEYIKDRVMDSNKDNLNWARDEEGQIDPHIDAQIQAHLDRGLSHTIGKSQLLSDGMWSYNMKEAERLQKAEEPPEAEPIVSPTPIAGPDMHNDLGNAYTSAGNIISGNTKVPTIHSSREEHEDYAMANIIRAVRDGEDLKLADSGEQAAYDIYKMIYAGDVEAIDTYISNSNNASLNNVIIEAAKDFGVDIKSQIQEVSNVDKRNRNMSSLSAPGTDVVASNILKKLLPTNSHIKMLKGLKDTFDADTPEKEQRLGEAVEQFGKNHSIISGTSYIFDDALRATYQERAVTQTSRDLHSANASIYQTDASGKSKDVKLKDLDKKVIDQLAKPSSSDVQGVVMHKGKPSYRTVQTIDGVTYNVYIPAIDLEAPFAVSTAVEEVIREGVTEVTKIPYQGRTLHAVPVYDKVGNKGYNVAIVETVKNSNGEEELIEHSFEELYKTDFRNLEKTYAIRSTRQNMKVTDEIDKIKKEGIENLEYNTDGSLNIKKAPFESVQNTPGRDTSTETF